jgi:transcriptional regulator with XRE-family HTH domain
VLTGEVLRAARAMARLDQAELAEAAGVSLETIKRLERIRGQINANVRTVSALIEALRRREVHIERHGDGSLHVFGRASPPGRRDARIPLGSETEAADLHRLIYFSRAAFEADRAEEALGAILTSSTRNNSERGLSGALVYSNGRFMQALEGGGPQVLAMYDAIRVDDRHRDLTVLESRPVAVRRFPDWLMCARTVSEAELARADVSQAGGLRPERLSPAAALGLLTWVADLEMSLVR